MLETKRFTAKRKAAMCTLVLVLVVSFLVLPQAFADLASSSGAANVLGVGRIQSQSTEASSPQTRFPSSASSSDKLATPLERETRPHTNAANTIGARVPAVGVWQSVKASAYGPGNAGRWTATGTELTRNSIGVAVDVSWSYLVGRAVEISYNGVTITTVIVDTGNLLALGRVLDLQPGIWKEFGAASEDEWGVRVVQWQLID